MKLLEAYKKSKYLSIKHTSYFQVYEDLLQKFVGTEIIFVEVGVLNGGSLFMWRDYFGEKARIIGIDFNPIAKKWQDCGFEIYIGDQADPNFWKGFYEQVGKIDILLDDGGHTNTQQIQTTLSSIKFIKNGGLLIVEDVHASYLSEYGNPSRSSFVNWAKSLIDGINSRYPNIEYDKHKIKSNVYSMRFYESFIVFEINKEKCIESQPISNEGQSVNAEDYRHRGRLLNNMIGLKQIFPDYLIKKLKEKKLIRKITNITLRVDLAYKNFKAWRKYF
jgi:hypothetical protein